MIGATEEGGTIFLWWLEDGMLLSILYKQLTIIKYVPARHINSANVENPQLRGKIIHKPSFKENASHSKG